MRLGAKSAHSFWQGWPSCMSWQIPSTKSSWSIFLVLSGLFLEKIGPVKTICNSSATFHRRWVFAFFLRFTISIALLLLRLVCKLESMIYLLTLIIVWLCASYVLEGVSTLVVVDFVNARELKVNISLSPIVRRNTRQRRAHWVLLRVPHRSLRSSHRGFNNLIKTKIFQHNLRSLLSTCLHIWVFINDVINLRSEILLIGLSPFTSYLFKPFEFRFQEWWGCFFDNWGSLRRPFGNCHGSVDRATVVHLLNFSWWLVGSEEVFNLWVWCNVVGAISIVSKRVFGCEAL